MAILLNDDELGALYGLPALPFRVYVQSIRPRMDIASGMVGFAYRISYQAIKEDIYVEPGPGIVRESVSTDQLFRAVRVLEKAGLIAISSEKAEKRLIFKCLLASLRSFAQNKPATKPRLEPASLEASNGKGFEGECRDYKNSEAATHQRSECTQVYKSSSSTRAPSIPRPQGGREETPVSIPPQGGACDPHGSTITTKGATNDLFGEQAPCLSSEEGVDFWPSGLNEQQRSAIAVKLRAVDVQRRQLVIDELFGHMTRTTGKPVENPVRYVDFVIQKAVLPLWFPEYAGKVQGARKAAEDHKKRVVHQQDFAPGSPAPDFVRAMVENMKRKTA